MAAITQQRIKVPSKQALEFLMAHWDRTKCPVIDGEFTIPEIGHELEVNPYNISHGIQNIRTETFDPNTNSVVADIIFTGPRSAEAIDEYVRGDIRFYPRTINAIPPGGSKKDAEEHIITWDLVHRPVDEAFKDRLKQEHAKMRAEANAKDKAIELAKKKLKK